MRAVGLDPDTRGTQAELARLSGVPGASISRWLAGGQQPTIQALRDIAPILRMRPVDLLVPAGHLEPSDLDPVGPVHSTPEDRIRADPDLSERDRRIILGLLAQMRDRTGYDNHTASPAPHGPAQDGEAPPDETA